MRHGLVFLFCLFLCISCAGEREVSRQENARANSEVSAPTPSARVSVGMTVGVGPSRVSKSYGSLKKGESKVPPPPLPRVLVYVYSGKAGDSSTSDGNKDFDLVAGAIEEHFLSKGFHLVDRAQIENIKQVDAAVTDTDPNKLLALKNRYGVEVIVACRVSVQDAGTTNAYDTSVQLYRYLIYMKAIEADTARIHFSKSLRTRNSVGSDTYLEDMARELAELCAQKLKKVWAKQRFVQSEFELVVSRAKHRDLLALEKALKGKVIRLDRRSYAKETAVYSLLFQGTLNQLEFHLKNAVPSWKVVRSTARRVEMEVRK
ncbi:MAG: hypothetical protein D6805_09520 [Planctomycetota bacterium]|nr:MAG: hypothetical protein D6805_09520 [Planctomycetota bacterium]